MWNFLSTSFVPKEKFLDEVSLEDTDDLTGRIRLSANLCKALILNLYILNKDYLENRKMLFLSKIRVKNVSPFISMYHLLKNIIFASHLQGLQCQNFDKNILFIPQSSIPQGFGPLWRSSRRFSRCVFRWLRTVLRSRTLLSAEEPRPRSCRA